MAEPITSAPRAGKGNGYDPDVLKSGISRIEAIYDDIASATVAHMSHCKELRDDIADVITGLKNKGIPSRPLRAVIKAREYERKAEAERAKLEGDSIDSYDQIRFALGDLKDTPLGKAAAAKAPDAPAEAKADAAAGIPPEAQIGRGKPAANDDDRDLRQGKGSGPRTAGPKSAQSSGRPLTSADVAGTAVHSL